MSNLKNNEPSENVLDLVDAVNELHGYRMSEYSEDQFEISERDFEKVVKKFQQKNKRGYDFLVRGGKKFKKAVFMLCKRMIDQETFPERFEETVLQQLYKGKGSRLELGNSRFIHLKEWLPRTCDALIVEKMKPDILASSSIFQIGGQAGHRTQEHLFTVRSVAALKMQQGMGIMLQVYDIRRFFDKENIRDVMNTLNEIGVNRKAYRTWFLLNQKTRISIKTGVGMTKECDVGEVVGQGTIGGALVSQLNVDRGVGDYFDGSRDETTYGSVRLQPMAFQDDILRLTVDVRSAQAGNIKLSCLMEDKQLECHPDKTGFVVMGESKYKKEVREQVREEAIMFGGFTTKEKMIDKYLGDLFSSEGLGDSILETIKDRTGKVKTAMMEVKGVMEDFRMQAVGGIMGAWDLWNRAIVPSLLANCGTWTELPNKAVELCDELQNMFIRIMLEVPVSTPKVALRVESGMLGMKQRIWIEKLKLAHFLRQSGTKSLAGRVYTEQLEHGWPGLASEVVKICQELEINNLNDCDVPKQKIRDAIDKHHAAEAREEMGKKLREIKDEEIGKPKDYMMTGFISDCRLQFRIRTNMVELKANMKGRFKDGDYSCIGCGDKTTIENQSHVIRCPAYADMRKGLNLEKNEDLVNYFRQVMLKRMKAKN